jgi:hypothetical protein
VTDPDPPGGSWLLNGKPVRPPNLRRLWRIGTAVFFAAMVLAILTWVFAWEWFR